MFTGIVQTIGKVTAIEEDGGRRFTLESDLDMSALTLGASVSHSGCCLTIESAREIEGGKSEHVVFATNETLSLTTLATWKVGTSVNLESSLRLGDELGGHLVFSHVDGLAQLQSMVRDGEGWRLRFSLPRALAGLVAGKGSVSLDGISLTVTDVDAASFGIAVIPHTFEVTTLKHRQVGDFLNFEADMLARYVQRQLSFLQN